MGLHRPHVPKIVKSFIVPEWKHQMSYLEFLDKAIEEGIQSWTAHCKKAYVGSFIYKHKFSGYRICEGKSFIWIQECYTRALDRCESRRQSGVYTSGLDGRRVAIGWVLQCVSEAYGIEQPQGFITEKAKRFVRETLNADAE